MSAREILKMDWTDISRENLISAKSLFQDARWRSALSRAYYTAYAAAAGALSGLTEYPKGRFGPARDRLPMLVMTYLTELQFCERVSVIKARKAAISPKNSGRLQIA